MAEYLQAPPRNPVLGLLSDILASGKAGLNSATVNSFVGNPYGSLLLNEKDKKLPSVPVGDYTLFQAPEFLNNMSYGNSPLIGGSGLQARLDPRALDVLPIASMAYSAGKPIAKTLGKEVARQVETGTGLLGSNVLNPRQYMFIGEKSKAWDTASNKVAKALEKEKVAPETIWSQTGNVKAPDGKWRQEIPDNEAMALQYPKDGSMLYLDKYSQELYNKPYGQLPFGEKGLNEKRGLGEQREKISKLAHAEMKKYEQVGTTLNHPKLYESYPNLKDIELSQWIGPREGSYYPKGRSNKEFNPYITVGAETPEQLKSTLLHELQHGIQMNEGFARGGSPTEFINNPTVFGGKFLGIPDLDKAVAKKYNVLTPMESYQRLLGEAESRLTQTRIPLTQEQRLQYYPYAQGQYGLDVPYNELIVKGLLD